MRLGSGRHRSHLLVLLLPTIVLALAVDPSGSGDNSAGSLSKSSVGKSGTKDAPVDGLDGKPHAGPFVDSTKKSPQKVEDLGKPRGKSGSAGNDKSSTKHLGPSEDDGVMSDVSNRKKVTGPTGIEGGVTQKERERKEKGQVGNRPEQPKEARPRPVSDEQEKWKGSSRHDKTPDKDGEKKKGAAGLEKPDDLPDKPHDIPHPKPASLQSSDHLKSHKSSKLNPGHSSDDGILHPFHSMFLAFTMIIFSEIGDKTFLVAALMAMRHDRMVVFSAAFAALVFMTVLSALLGHAVPTLLPKKLTGFGAAILFFVFGIKLLREGLAMAPDEGVGEEMKEVEMELEEKEQEMRRSKRRNSITPYALEAGRGRGRASNTLPTLARSPSSSPSPPPSPGARNSLSSLAAGFNNLCSLLLSPAWVQTFVMTFLGEWGDRSQIATIAMAAGQDYWWITGGAVIGHGICTAVAVIGGRAIAGRVSMRIVTLGGAIAFLVFGVIYLAESIYSR